MGFAVIPDESEVNMLSRVFADATAIGVGLYVNDLDPGQDTVLADITQASYDGYAAQPLTWDPAATVAHKATLGSHTVSFAGPATGGPVDIYGWYLVGVWPDATHLVMVKRLTTAPTTLADGDASLTVTIEFRGFDFHQP